MLVSSYHQLVIIESIVFLKYKKNKMPGLLFYVYLMKLGAMHMQPTIQHERI